MYFTKRYSNGISYFKDEECTIIHREDGPAREYHDGSKHWFINGKPHKEDGPAFQWANGKKEWYINGKLHREDGPAVEYSNGHKCHKEWYINGKCHREDGPAVEYSNGQKCYYLDDVLYSEENFLKEMNIRKRFRGFI